MNILLDMNLTPLWIPLLESKGYKTKHWKDIGSISAPDTEIMEWARKNDYLVFTHDLDFGALLFATQVKAPSVLQLRCEDVRPKSVGDVVLHILSKAEKEIEQGALIIVDLRRSRIRLLPLKSRVR